MNYQVLIEQNIGTVYQAGIATKILQHMDRIRNVSDVSQARRWVMELFQNSRDAAYEDQPVKIRIELKEDRLSFSHNGRPFRVKDILSIINQVSSKTPGENTIGQFGTGFMTTYQLSEEVEIQAVLKDGALPYKPFSIRMDRRGTTKEEILSGIFDTMEELKKADQSEDMGDFKKDNYNTRFLYHLDSEESRKIARIGMTDLQETILYVLLFSERIASVELSEEADGISHRVIYERGEGEELENGLKRLCIFKNTAVDGQTTKEPYFLLWISEGDVTLAAGCGREEMIKLSDRLPRLFVDFPLIGAERFPFPVVINCRNFRTNEPRSGITLVDNTASKDALVNKEIMDRAVALYGHFLHGLIQLHMKRLDYVTAVPLWKPDREMSEEWVKEHLYGRLYGIVSKEPMIRTEKGSVAFENQEFYLVSGADLEETGRLRKLLSVLKGIEIPVGQEDWNEAFAGYEMPEEKCLRLETVLCSAQKFLARQLKEEEMEPIAWCQFLYEAAMKNPGLATRIKAGEILIFPNQNPEDWRQRRLFGIRSIRRDTGIPEIFKEVSDILDRLDSQRGEEALKIRDGLLHLEFDDKGLGELEDYEQSRLQNHILTRSNRKYPVRNFSIYKEIYEKAWEQAWLLLISCGADEGLYHLCREVYKEALPQRQPLEDDSYFNGMWRNSYYWILSEILGRIGREQNMKQLFEHMFPNRTKEQVYKWLNEIYGKALLYMGESDARMASAFPNQNGVFKAAWQLKRDETAGEELKEIAREFKDIDVECDVYPYTLDRNICLEHGYGLAVLREDEAAMRIHRAVQQILSTKNLSDAQPWHQEACTRLLAWIQEHQDRAEKYFPGYCREEEQMKLLTPKAAVRMQRKARDCQKILEELEAETMEEVMEKLAGLKKERQEEEELSGISWDGVAWDEGLRDAFGNVTDREKEEILRQIGVGGEAYALEEIKRHFQNLGYEKLQETGDQVLLKKMEEGREACQVRIYYPDSRHYHQPGWDIFVSMAGERGREEYFLEVKTHTSQSRDRNLILLSNEQMKAAVRNREQYVVLRVLYNYRSRQGEQILAFPDPMKQIEKGVFTNRQSGYPFYVKENEEKF